MSLFTSARRRLATVALAAGALLVSGCSVYDLPLPGGADSGKNPMTVKVKFRDVLDLVPQSTVKVDDVTVGKVKEIALQGYTAVVSLELPRDLDLPDNTYARIRQTSLLGEKFVSLEKPETPAGKLSDGDVISLENSGRNPEVEEVFSALALLLNGGGVGQLKTISQELNTALEGREGDVKSVIRQVRSFMGQLDRNKGAIITALENVNRLSLQLRRQDGTIKQALDEIPAALRSVDSQRKDLVRMLKALNRLSGVGVEVIQASKASTVETLKNLAPVLHEFAEAGDALPRALQVFLTYPFVDEAVGRDPVVARNLHMGDYVNLAIKLDIRLDGSMQLPVPTLVPSEVDPTVVVNDLLNCLTSGSLTSPECKKVLQTPGNLLKLQKLCKKKKNKDLPVCTLLNGLGLDLGLDELGEGLGEGLGLRRSATGEKSLRGTTNLGTLMETYDPTLARILLPGVAQ